MAYKILSVVKIPLAIFSFASFAFCIYFWVLKVAYCVHGYFTHGAEGILAALHRGVPISLNPDQQTLSPEITITLAIVLMLILTVFSFLGVRKYYREFLEYIKN